MLRDVEFFQSRLGKIDGFEDAGEYLVNVINNKQVLAPPPAPAPEPEPEPEPEPTPSPPPAAPSPAPAPETPNEGAEGNKSAEEQPTEPQATEETAEVEKNGVSDDASKA